jgi:hypothetical protein
VSVILSAIADFAWLFYIAIGLAALYSLFALLSGLRNLSRSAFAMEKMRARNEISSAAMKLLLCAVGGTVLFGLLSQIEGSATGVVDRLTTARPGAATPIPITPQFFGTPPAGVATTRPITGAAPALPLGPTPTALSPAAQATVSAGGLPPNNCGSVLVKIDAIAAPAKQLTITGTAIVEAGGHWRLELLQPGGVNIMLQRGEVSALGPNIVRGLTVQTLPSGTYGARVTSVRADGTIGGICQRSVGIGTS